MSDIVDLKGRVGLVTGAGQGVGRRIALEFARHGAGGVVVNDYVQEQADAVAAEIEAAGGQAIALQGDVTDLASMRRIVAAARERFGGVDVLVNNAGNASANPSGDHDKPFWETGRAAWDSYLGVNLYGVMNSVAAVVPGMIDRGSGRIITGNL